MLHVAACMGAVPATDTAAPAGLPAKVYDTLDPELASEVTKTILKAVLAMGDLLCSVSPCKKSSEVSLLADCARASSPSRACSSAVDGWAGRHKPLASPLLRLLELNRRVSPAWRATACRVVASLRY